MGIKRKYKNPEIRTGKNNVLTNVPIGLKIKDICVLTNIIRTISKISNVQNCSFDLNNTNLLSMLFYLSKL